jgi:hypothetical protein
LYRYYEGEAPPTPPPPERDGWWMGPPPKEGEVDADDANHGVGGSAEPEAIED